MFKIPLGYYAARALLQKYHAELLEPQLENTKITFSNLFPACPMKSFYEAGKLERKLKNLELE